MTASNWAIDVQGLSKQFGGRTVVDQVDLQIAPGRICGFLGPNGSGKTTTIRMLCGLLSIDAGQGQCLGLDIRRDALAIRRQVGYMTQKFGLYEDLTLRENLDFIARLFEVKNRQELVSATLERLGLSSRQKQLAGSLSGGWKQRLALAACLIHQPRLLLLDEPTAGVDPKARREFWDQIHALAADGITVLVSTHYMDEAERCHELVYIAYGKILARGSEADILRQARLQVWQVQLAADAPPGTQLAHFLPHLQALPGVNSVAAFGNSLHIAATAQTDSVLAQALQQTALSLPLRIEACAANLEDVFINLLNQAQDNFAPDSMEAA